MQPKVSVIISVYNPGQHFIKCIDSIVNQTLRDIEIIIVLDCPTDGSDKIAERYAAKDHRIKLIYNKINLHAGFSRNIGLEIATGEYIGFMDSDDYCELNKYELLYNKATSNDFEMAGCNYYVEQDGILSKYSFNLKETDNINDVKKQIYTSCLLVKKNGLGYTWRWIYKASFLKKYDIKFYDSRVTIEEDCLFSLLTYYYAEKIAAISEHLTYYVQVKSSLCHTKSFFAPEKRFTLLLLFVSFFQEKRLYDEYKFLLATFVARRIYSIFRFGLFSTLIKIINHPQFSELLRLTYRRKVLKELKPTIIVFLFFILPFFSLSKVFKKKYDDPKII